MKYKTFNPHADLESIVNCYWTLEVPKTENTTKQRIVPDGTIEMAFILGEDIKRYTSDTEYILQPRSMILGQTIKPFYIEPTGYVNTFGIRFYPHGFANFVIVPIETLVNKETPIEELFGADSASALEKEIIAAVDTSERIGVIEKFLFNKLKESFVVDNIVNKTVESILATKGGKSISDLFLEDSSKRRQLERKFRKQIGISPKQLGKVIRLQYALKMLLNKKDSLTHIAHMSDYYDQSHFIKDFKEFTGINPKEFLENENMALSALFYK